MSTYFAGYIDGTGPHVPSFSQIETDAVSKYQAIFGADSYLENDSQDYQQISALSSYVADLYQMAVQTYLNQNPQTATGTPLDSIVKLNGLTRKIASYSICTVTLTGTAFALITNGVISDGSYNWDLPVSVTLDSTGSATVTATCETIGAINASIGTLINIVTPTFGWTSVTNASSASLGLPIESDPVLKSRQSTSTSISAQTLMDSTMAAINSVSGVTASRAYQNNTGSTDANGAPAYCIYPVVQGGTDQAVADAIFIQKNPGVLTYGTTTINEVDSYGNIIPISFYRPTTELIDVVVNITHLTGYNSTYVAAIQTAVANYINSIGIGNNLVTSALWGIVSSVMPNPSSPIFSITSLTDAIHGNSQGTSSITIPFNGIAVSNIITVNVS